MTRYGLTERNGKLQKREVTIIAETQERNEKMYGISRNLVMRFVLWKELLNDLVERYSRTDRYSSNQFELGLDKNILNKNQAKHNFLNIRL